MAEKLTIISEHIDDIPLLLAPLERMGIQRLLERLQKLTLIIIREGRRQRSHLTPLSRMHQCILDLLEFPVEIYTNLYIDSRKPT